MVLVMIYSKAINYFKTQFANIYVFHKHSLISPLLKTRDSLRYGCDKGFEDSRTLFR